MKQEKKNADFKQSFSNALSAVLVSVSVLFLLILLVSFLVHKEKVALEAIPAITLVIHFIALLAGGLIKGTITKTNTIIETVVTAGIYSLILAAVAIVLFDGININALWHLFAAVAGGTCAVLLYYSLENKTKKPRKRKRNW